MHDAFFAFVAGLVLIICFIIFSSTAKGVVPYSDDSARALRSGQVLTVEQPRKVLRFKFEHGSHEVIDVDVLFCSKQQECLRLIIEEALYRCWAVTSDVA